GVSPWSLPVAALKAEPWSSSTAAASDTPTAMARVLFRMGVSCMLTGDIDLTPTACPAQIEPATQADRATDDGRGGRAGAAEVSGSSVRSVPVGRHVGTGRSPNAGSPSAPSWHQGTAAPLTVAAGNSAT